MADRIRKRLDRIAADPYVNHAHVTRLQGRPTYRLRVANWRVIYAVENEALVIPVIKIAPRGEVY
ncbi:MAG: type II toxin-antitoxin system RelE family toxin [Candidatus Promineifilaceae bacterium]